MVFCRIDLKDSQLLFLDFKLVHSPQWKSLPCSTPKSTHPNATFYFTHSGTVLKLLSHLGLYKDNFVLTHKDFEKERQFETSKIDAFASNIQFILYDCKDEPKVLTMHQERIVNIPGCTLDNDLCSLSTLKNIFEDSLNCNFDEICQLTNSEESS
uniref:Uncharacterized protein n=1 Tax=Megaselia scalaris TaxID=36166 RepID=T1H3T8_MEGSC